VSKITFIAEELASFSKNDDLESRYNDLAIKAADFLKSKAGNLLQIVHLKGEGLGYYWSLTEKKLILVPRKAEFYILPWAGDDKHKKYLFLPLFLKNGSVLTVDEDEIEYLGYN